MQEWLNQIHCGDCLELMKRLPDKCVDLVLTDPPYGIGETNKKNLSRETKGIRSKDYGEFTWDTKRIDRVYFDEMQRISKNQIIFGGNYYTDFLSPTPCWIFWDKEQSGDFADGELAWASFGKSLRRFKWRWNGMLQQDMKNKEERIHPTQKPVKLGVWILNQYSKPGEIILDCFAGSGSFLVAAAQLGRKWIGFEIDPKYVNLARERIKRETAQLSIFNPVPSHLTTACSGRQTTCAADAGSYAAKEEG